MKPLHFAAVPAGAFGSSRQGRISPRRSSMLDVCAALILTLAGLLGLEGTAHGE